MASVDPLARFPSTRYQGSKRKLLGWLRDALAHLDYDSVLDPFSGTASVAYLFKTLGKTVTTNDYLQCNRHVAEALVCNDGEVLGAAQRQALAESATHTESGFIATTFAGLFYPDDENRWLDAIATRLQTMPDGAQRSLAYFALFQACLAKRPFNLFHRANLALRTAEVPRSFGNKATWERPFAAHFDAALDEAQAALFDNGRKHRALRGDYLTVPGHYDLVYLDPPYLNARGKGVDYLDFYHFLEGLCRYAEWPEQVTSRRKHRPWRPVDNPWSDPRRIDSAFDAALDRFRESIVVLSYRDDGMPSVAALQQLLQRHGRRRVQTLRRDYRYALSNKTGGEVLLIAEP